MIINILANFVAVITNFLTKIVTLAILPNSVVDNITDIVDTLFDNFTMVNIVCHLSYLKVILGLIISITAFRVSFNMLRFVVTRGH